MMLASRSFVKSFHISHIILQFAAMFYAEEAGWSGALIGYSMRKAHLEWKYKIFEIYLA